MKSVTRVGGGEDSETRPFFFQSSRIRVDLLSYEGKPTDEREQCDWKAEKNLDGKPDETVFPGPTEIGEPKSKTGPDNKLF